MPEGKTLPIYCRAISDSTMRFRFFSPAAKVTVKILGRKSSISFDFYSLSADSLVSTRLSIMMQVCFT